MGPALEAIREPRRCLQFLLLLAAFLLGGMYPALAADPTGYVTVVVANKGANTIYVAFTNYATQQPGQINWGNCASSVSNNQVSIASGGTCTASVPNNVGTSRFCASTTAMATPNCNNAQANHQTMIETNFGSGAASTCYPTSMASCVWYDISLIPSNCTDAAWAQNQCASTGGAAYNLPVSLACSAQPTYTCQGPPGTQVWQLELPDQLRQSQRNLRRQHTELRECLLLSDVLRAAQPAPAEFPVSGRLVLDDNLPGGTIAVGGGG